MGYAPIPEARNDDRAQASGGLIFWIKIALVATWAVVGGFAKANSGAAWTLPAMAVIVGSLIAVHVYDIWFHDRVLAAFGRSRRPTWTQRVLHLEHEAVAE